MSNNFCLTTKVQKVDESLGLIFGWGIICKVNGEDYYDLQDDHIPESVMFAAVTDFMKNSNIIRDMHIKEESGRLPGTVLFSFPMTEEVAKSFDIETKTTGWLVAVMPDDKEVLKKFASGEYTGFSIGGSGFYG